MVWMAVECAVSLLGAVRAHSAALLAFGSDSLVELVSAVIVVLQFAPRFAISERRASKAAAILLVALAAVVTLIAVSSLIQRERPEPSMQGIILTVIALIVMPILGIAKRQEAKRLNNSALAADAVQSATCAYLAGVTLIGLALNAVLHCSSVDSAAALVAVPLLLKESRDAWRGRGCCCHWASSLMECSDAGNVESPTLAAQQGVGP